MRNVKTFTLLLLPINVICRKIISAQALFRICTAYLLNYIKLHHHPLAFLIFYCVYIILLYIVLSYILTKHYIGHARQHCIINTHNHTPNNPALQSRSDIPTIKLRLRIRFSLCG